MPPSAVPILGRRHVLLAAAAAPVLGGRTAHAQPAAPVVETASGKLRGDGGNGVRSFKGVPYAAPTGGANRFLPPAAAAPWPQVRDATAFGNSAPQTPPAADALSSWYTAIQPTGEDCLSLNVWAPSAPAAPRPVMVWLHGGAWVSCAGSAPGFDGTVLARDGDVVVVTINHRLNLFGYIQLDDPGERFARSGNAGVLDMVAALQWVRDNIHAFGGDPANVTIFGQSGGGAKVSALLALPAAKGLFHRAIAESCSGSLRLAGKDEAARLAHGLASTLGLAKPTGEALQAVPVDTLISAMAQQPPMFRPVLDGLVFPANPFDDAAPASAAGVPVMFGNAATETTLYMAADPRNFALDAPDVARRLTRFLRTDPNDTRRIMDAYAVAMPNATPSQIMAAVTTDYTYRRNTTQEAVLQSSTAANPVYTYVFDWQTPVMNGNLHSPHTSEVPFVFGTAHAAAGLVGTGPYMATLTRILGATWSSFARTGNPANEALPHWPRFDPAGRQTMLLSTDSRVAANPDGERRHALDPLPFFEYSMPITYPKPA